MSTICYSCKGMTVYIEYAFLENFLLDGVLLWLSLRASRTPFSFLRLFFAATVGGVFAVLFPLVKLPSSFSLLLKIAVGLFMCMLLHKRLRTKKDWGRYALNAVLFFTLTFAFGGALYGNGVSYPWIAVGFLSLSVVALILVEKLYKRKAIYQNVYDCRISIQGKSLRAQGFLDSGNLATKNGIPVCFLSTDALYDLYGQALLENERGEQVCDEIQIDTMSGRKTLPLYKGTLWIKNGKASREKEVYFAPSTNMITREYKVLLHSRILEEGEEV